MKKILVVVDMQNDFIDGALGTPEAQAIVPNVVKEIEEYDADFIIYTMDTHLDHYMNTLEGKRLPVPHCIENTEGWRLNTEVWNSIFDNRKALSSVIYKGTFGAYAEEYTHLLDGYNDEIDEIEIIGLCTDVCVISNAIILRSLYPNTPIKVKADCCAGVTPESHKNALAAMKMCQIDVIGE